MSLRAGDPVMLVWGCCAEARRHIGWTGKLEAIGNGSSMCIECRSTAISVPHGVIHVLRLGPVPLSWLVKMPPPGAPAEGEQLPAELEA